MSWNYSGFVGEKVEAGRRLLASDPAWAGSEDLRAVVEDKDLTDALRRTFLLPSGERRQGLSLHDKRQGLILFLMSARRKLEMRVHQHLDSYSLIKSITDAVKQVGSLRGGCSTATAFQHLAPLADTASVLLCVSAEHTAFRHQLPRLCAEWTDEHTALATQLEAELRAAGHDPLLTASDQQRLFLLLAPLAARQLEAGPSWQPQVVQLMRQVARRNSSRLVQLHPGSAALKLVHAFVLSLDASLGRETAAAYRAALQAAEASKSYMLSAYAVQGIVFHLLHGAEGPTWPLAEVRSLLQQAERNFKRCKPWQFCNSGLLEELNFLKQEVATAVAASPRSQRLPMTASLDETFVPAGSEAPACDACGMPSPKLRRCAACESRAYCCRECQVADWKRGHKAECARLAAQRGGSS